VALAWLALQTARAGAAEEPWTDPDPPKPPERYPLGDFGFQFGAEYRAQGTYINSISLNTINERRLGFIEHRLRVDGAADYDEKVRIVTSIDILDGVLWGDNGTVGSDPEPENGTTVNTKNPNEAVPCIGYKGGEAGDPLSASDYGFVLCESDIFNVRKLYGEVVTPIGLLRVGRQPFTLGYSIQGATADGRANRFGIARRGSYVDRIVFGTKPLEAFKEEKDRDLGLENGFFVTVLYDHLVSDDLRLFNDDERQVGGAVFYRASEYPIGKDLEAMGYYVHRWSDEHSTNVNIFGGRAISRFGPVFLGIEGAANIGTTREIATAYRVINNDPIVDQEILQVGARAVARYDWPVVRAGEERKPGLSVYLELDYASGDGDPEARTDLSQMVWAPDMNVGLLMFEHIIAYESARRAEVGIHNLEGLDAPSFPLTEASTESRLTNAIVLFPQAQYVWLDNGEHRFHTRVGVLAAWPASPDGAVDPVLTSLSEDGLEIRDDARNYHGGDPGNYYGTEFDLQLQWLYRNGFAWTVEAAALKPGSSLRDANGDAVPSFFLENRFEFLF